MDVDGATVSLDLLGADPTVTRFTLPDGADRIKVTEERVPGSTEPSGPLAAARLSR